MNPVRFQPWQVLAVLLACEVAFAAIYFLSINIGSPSVHQLFDLDQEANIPAWFSSTQLFCIAVVLALFGPSALQAIHVPAYVPLLAAGVFLFLSMDEAAQVHERVGRALRSVPLLPRVRNDRGMWVFVYLIALLPFLYLAVRHLPALWRSYRTTVIAGVCGCGLIAVGAGGVELIADQFLRGFSDVRHLYLLTVLAEEILEMIGASLILFGTLCLATPANATSRWSPAPARVRHSIA